MQTTDFDYDIVAGAIVITEYTGSGGKVTIPENIDGLPVTSIGNNAFHECSDLTGVVIPRGIVSIGDYAFLECQGLTEINFPASVISIGKLSFGYCSRLCTITVDARNSYFSSVDGVLFNKTRTELVLCPAGNIRTNYTIPNEVISIASSAFLACENLISVNIPNRVTSIGNEVFSCCTILTKIAVAPNNPDFIDVGGVLFNKSQTSIIAYPASLNFHGSN